MNAHDALQEQDWPINCSQSIICHALDEAAHCSICRDFFNTPLSLLCGHSCKSLFAASSYFVFSNLYNLLCTAVFLFQIVERGQASAHCIHP